MWTPLILLIAFSLVVSIDAQGQPQQPSPCVGKFDTGFRKCFNDIVNLNLEAVFFLVTNGKGGKLTQQQQANAQTLKQNVCRNRQRIIQCIQPLPANKDPSCVQDDVSMMSGTITTMTNGLGTMCGTGTGPGGQPSGPGQQQPTKCMQTFEAGMNKCAQDIFQLEMELILKVVNNRPLPQGQDPIALKKQICTQWKRLEVCGKNVVVNANCERSELLPAEVTFAQMMLSAATFCGDKSMPGACLLTLQKQFGDCYGKVGLDAAIYLGNGKDNKGALIGSNMTEVQKYCSKKHDLYTCMQEVVNTCPGADQTLSLTGFDLNAMERAVGRLCHDIPLYLEGLDCFETPTETAMGCMKEMSMSITSLATQKVTQKMSMDDFFTEFCSARVKHVGCDAKAWPACNKPAVELKTEFECELIPSSCFNSHRDNIDKICHEMVIPTGNTTMHVDKSAECAQNIGSTMNQCFSQYGLEPDMFLINVTHDRSNFIGDNAKAKSLCTSRQDVFSCMRNALKACPPAKDVLAYWGHQQSALEGALNIVCNELPLYIKGHSCFDNVNAQVQQCITDTESNMMTLANKQLTQKLSPDAYFREFCKIRIQHLKCDLDGWGSQCSTDVLGLKTEYECRLIQQHCKNLQVSNFKNICNDNTYAKSQRQSGSGSNNPGGAGVAISGTVATLTAGLFAVILVLM